MTSNKTAKAWGLRLGDSFYREPSDKYDFDQGCWTNRQEKAAGWFTREQVENIITNWREGPRDEKTGELKYIPFHCVLGGSDVTKDVEVVELEEFTPSRIDQILGSFENDNRTRQFSLS